MREKVRITFFLVNKYKKYILGLGVVSLVIMIVMYMSPLLNTRIIDVGIQEKKINIILQCLIYIFLLNICCSVLMYVESEIQIKYKYKMETYVKNVIIKKFMKEYNNHNKMGRECEFDTLIRSDVGEFISFVSSLFQGIVLASIKIVCLSFLLIKIQWFLGCGLIILQVIFILLNRVLMKKLEAISTEMRETFVEMISSINEIILHIKELHLLNGTKYMLGKYNSALYKSYATMKKNNRYIQISLFFSTMMELVLQIFLIGFGGWLIIKNEFSIGFLVSYMSYSSMLHNSFEEILSTWSSYSENRESLDLVYDALGGDLSEKELCFETIKRDITVESIQFLDTSFSYGENCILDTANVVFNNKKINYILGRSGVGKTTLSEILLGFLKLNSGKIMINDRNLDDIITQGEITNYFSWIPQEPIMFYDTVKNNIAMDYNVDDNRIIEVCKICMLHNDIMNLPDGYNTNLGEHGDKLSVGQKHRLGIARALINEKPIIIMDEGTAGLDERTEFKIKENLKKICKDKLAIIITHSENFILSDANIYEMSNCKLIERKKTC